MIKPGKIPAFFVSKTHGRHSGTIAKDFFFDGFLDG
jgi:hypothetical protein